MQTSIVGANGHRVCTTLANVYGRLRFCYSESICLHATPLLGDAFVAAVLAAPYAAARLGQAGSAVAICAAFGSFSENPNTAP